MSLSVPSVYPTLFTKPPRILNNYSLLGYNQPITGGDETIQFYVLNQNFSSELLE